MATLSFEQFKELKARGLSNDQIRRFSNPLRQAAVAKVREGEMEFEQAQKPRSFLDTAAGGTPEDLYAQAESSPSSFEQNLLRGTGAVQQAGKDLFSIPANYFNQLALNAPRSITNKLGFKYDSSAENPLIDVVGKGAGIAGAFTPVSAIGRTLLAPKSISATASKSPQVMTAIRGLKGADMGTKIKTVLGLAGKMGLTGAAYGAAYSPEDFTDVGSRGRQALAGGLMGAGVGVPATLAAERLVVPAVKFIRKFGTRAKGKAQFPTQDFTKATTEKVERAKTGAITQEDLLTKQMDDVKSRTSTEITPMEQDIAQLSAQKEAVGEVFGRKKQIYGKAKERVNDYVSRRTKELDSELTKVAESTALNSKQRIKDFNSSFHDKFDKVLTDLDIDLSQRGLSPDAQEISDVLGDISQELSERGIQPGAKFSDFMSEINSANAQGRELNLTWLTNKLKSAKPAKGKLVRGVTGVEDVGMNRLQSWFMDWVEKTAPEYKDLTTKSKTAIQVRNYLAQKAKTGDVFETKEMTQMMKDLASGKLSSADTQRINILEQGTGGFKGAGEFTGQVKQKGQQIQQFQSDMAMAQKKLAESTDALSEIEATKKNVISRRIQDIQNTIETKKKIEANDVAKIQSELDTLTNELNTKIEKIKAGPITGEKNIRRLKDSVSAINVLRKAVGVAAGTAIGTSAAMASLRSIGRALRYNIGNNE